MPSPPRASRAVRLGLAAIFVAGLGLRIAALRGTHDEGDEIVYRTLVAQLEQGRGYTLEGTSLLDAGWPRAQYGRRLFFHPPGGVLLFLLAHRVLGDAGYAAVQVLSYAAFFAGMLWLGALVLPGFGGAVAIAVGALAATTPLMAHVTSRHWLDGPLLACATLASALFLEAVRRGRMTAAVVAGAVLGYASLIKPTAFLVVPVLVLLAGAAWRPPLRDLGRFAACLTVVAAVVHAPWPLWQWVIVGSPFPQWAGRPARELVTSNPYVYFVTVIRRPWSYLELLPRVLWTLVPSLVCTTMAGFPPRERRIAGALIAWIACVVGAHVALGALGYSKVLRYVILVTPATVLLFGLVVGVLRARLAGRRPRGVRGAGVVLLAVLAAAGLALEIVQGVYTPLVDSDLDLVRPLFSTPG